MTGDEYKVYTVYWGYKVYFAINPANSRNIINLF
jgi:hypothetical protein